MGIAIAKGLPPAIIVGVDSPIGLTLIRELGGHGVAVHGIGSRNGVGLSSRWLTSRHQRPSDFSDLVILINEIAKMSGPSVLLTVSESDCIALRQADDADMFKNIKVLVPSLAKLRLVQDKQETYRIASEAGVPLPATWSPDDAEERAPEGITYPCVVKWADPAAVNRSLLEHGLELKKFEYCYSPSDLRKCLRRYAPVARFPLVQSFCPGVGIGHMLFMHQGRALLRFGHRRLAEWPPEGGVSVVCESVAFNEDDPLVNSSEELLLRMGWEGAAMVEYRYDPRSGRTALMEVNGRFWGSLPLAYHSGAWFGWYTYAVLGAGLTLGGSSYRSGRVCRYVVPEAKRLLTLLFKRHSIQNRALDVRPISELVLFVVRFLDPRVRYFVFSWRDPRPFFHDVATMLKKALRQVARPKMQRAVSVGMADHGR